MPCDRRAAKPWLSIHFGPFPDRVAIGRTRYIDQILHIAIVPTSLPSCFEVLRVLHLDTLGMLVAVTEHSNGPPGRVAIPIRRIVADALACEATTLVLSHNHPGGNPQPSRADIAATNELIRTVAPLGIRVHDHIVTGARCDFSFRAAGLR